jgi:cation/acetate symporter
MVVGITFTASYIIYFTFINPEINNADHWWFGISPEGIGTVGMLLNFAFALGVAKFTKKPPVEIQELVENIRVPGKLRSQDDLDNES